MPLSDIVDFYKRSKLADIAKLASDLEQSAKQNITDPATHAFLARMGRVVHDFHSAMKLLIDSAPADLQERIATFK